MKKIILGFILSFLITIISVIAIPNPAPIYCENMGYTSDGSSCIFDDGESCELLDFYNGVCGAEYVKELTCKQEGESLSPGYECCEGLVSKTPGVYDASTGICGMIIGSFGICTPCGNGVCDEELENYCNCPEDCEIYTEKTSTEKKCAQAGEEADIHGEKWGQATVCCSGLLAIAPTLVPDNGVCPKEPLPDYGTQFLCIKCGDGICGIKENKCNCPEDCGEEGEEIIIEKKPSGKTSIKSDSVEATTLEKVEIVDSKLTMETSEGNKEVIFLPNKAISKTEIREILKTELIQESNKPIYLISGTNKGKLFFVFPITAEIEQKIDAETGEIISTKKPWWVFLASGI